MLNPGFYENSLPGGVGVLEILSSPQERGIEQPRLFVPLRRTELSGEIRGAVAHLVLRQVYSFSEGERAHPVEALYRFPLPGDAAVMGVVVRFGEVEIHTELRERQQAEDEYQAAKNEGRQAAMMTQEAADVFTLRVAGIRPGEEVQVETRFVERARAEGAGWSLRVPLTVAPRYVRGDERGSRAAEAQPLALFRDPQHTFRLDVGLREVTGVESPTHRLDLQEEEGSALRLRLQEREVVPDRDLVLRWGSPSRERDVSLTVSSHESEEHLYFQALITPPAASQGETMAREVALLLDRSGSMSGPKWEAAKWAARRFLTELSERDRFAFGGFDDELVWHAREFRQATSREVKAAIRFLDTLEPRGGTELGVALEQSLGLKRGREVLARHVLLITDAEVSDRGRLLRLMETEAQRADRRRLSVLCIDAAPNSLLVHDLVQVGGGSARFLTSDPQQGDIATALDEVLEEWTAPLLDDLRLIADAPELQVVGHEVRNARAGEGTSADLGLLSRRRPLWVVGRVPKAGGPVALRLESEREGLQGQVELAPGEEQPALLPLFGAARVRRLEDLAAGYYSEEELKEALQRGGYRESEIRTGADSVYAENQREGQREAMRRLLVQESLAYGVLSSETAFVAVREERGGEARVEETVEVPNALPQGWSGHFLALAFAAPVPRRVAGLFHRSASPMDASLSAGGAASLPQLDGALYEMGDGMQDLDGVLLEDNAPVDFLKLPAPPTSPTSPRPGAATALEWLFEGVPAFQGREAEIFQAPEGWTLGGRRSARRLEVRFPGGAPTGVGEGLVLEIYLGDPVSPRARVRLRDLIRQDGERPLHLSWQEGDLVRVVLRDADGEWSETAPELAVRLLP